MEIIQKVSNGATDEIDKKVVETQPTTVTAIATATSDVLNSLILFLIINQVMLSNLSPQ